MSPHREPPRKSAFVSLMLTVGLLAAGAAVAAHTCAVQHRHLLGGSGGRGNSGGVIDLVTPW